MYYYLEIKVDEFLRDKKLIPLRRILKMFFCSV